MASTADSRYDMRAPGGGGYGGRDFSAGQSSWRRTQPDGMAATGVTFPIPLIQAFQSLTVLIAAPGISGVITTVETRLQGRRGTRISQPYRDLAKLFRKESLAPVGASWVFLAAPVLAMVCYLTVPLLIPVLTTYGLPLGYMGDILAGGFLLSMAGFAVAVAAAETGAPFAQLGASRAKSFGAITEPVVLFVVFAVALLTGTDLPYALAETVRASAGQILRPAHLLASAALLLVILFETARIPVEGHSSTTEFGMIDAARTFEHSGPYLALLHWGSEMKQMVFYVLLINVFVAPWGLASDTSVLAVLLAIAAIVGKCLALGVIVAVIDNTWAKLRLLKITEFTAAAFLLSVLAVVTLYAGVG